MKFISNNNGFQIYDSLVASLLLHGVLIAGVTYWSQANFLPLKGLGGEAIEFNVASTSSIRVPKIKPAKSNPVPATVLSKTKKQQENPVESPPKTLPEKPSSPVIAEDGPAELPLHLKKAETDTVGTEGDSESNRASLAEKKTGETEDKILDQLVTEETKDVETDTAGTREEESVVGNDDVIDNDSLDEMADSSMEEEIQTAEKVEEEIQTAEKVERQSLVESSSGEVTQTEEETETEEERPVKKVFVAEEMGQKEMVREQEPITAQKGQRGLPQGTQDGRLLEQTRGNTPITYPITLRRKKITGTVVLEYSVTESGKVVNVRVARSSGYKAFDYEAARTVATWKYKPGQGGQTIHPIVFRLVGPGQQEASRLRRAQ